VKSRYISQADQNNINAARGVAGKANQNLNPGNTSGPSAPQNPGGATGKKPDTPPEVKPRDPGKPFVIKLPGDIYSQ